MSASSTEGKYLYFECMGETSLVLQDIVDSRRKNKSRSPINVRTTDNTNLPEHKALKNRSK